MINKTLNKSIKKTNFSLSSIKLIKFNKFSFSILLILIMSLNGFSQAGQRLQIVEKSNFLSALRTSSSTTTLFYNSVVNLFNGVNSSIYLSNNQVTTIGANPVCMYTDVTSLSIANNPSLRVNDVKLVTIKIDNPAQLNGPINLGAVSRYNNVKYIYFKVSFDFQLSQLMSRLLEVDPKVVLIYSVDKRS